MLQRCSIYGQLYQLYIKQLMYSVGRSVDNGGIVGALAGLLYMKRGSFRERLGNHCPRRSLSVEDASDFVFWALFFYSATVSGVNWDITKQFLNQTSRLLTSVTRHTIVTGCRTSRLRGRRRK